MHNYLRYFKFSHLTGLLFDSFNMNCDVNICPVVYLTGPLSTQAQKIEKSDKQSSVSKMSTLFVI